MYMTEKQYEHELSKIRMRNKSVIRKQLLKSEKNKYKNKHTFPSTTKLVVFYLFLLLNVLLVYSMVAMWHFSDLSYLGVLITDVIAQLITFLIYSVKSTKENTVGGITYDLAMKNNQFNSIQETESPVG